MKILITTIMIFLSANTFSDSVYRCGNSYQPEPCYGEINRMLNYTPMTQEQKDFVEYARVEQDLNEFVENSRLESFDWQQLEQQRNIEAAKLSFLKGKLRLLQRRNNYQRAQAVMQFKHSREYEIFKTVKENDNQMLDNIAWKLIHMPSDGVWHQSSINRNRTVRGAIRP